uniref:Osteoclast-stimulating factor 1 n=1 Tax=Pygocentrus nattereri TaxID=42514 RepID=A0AAR2JPG0_PYGNA
MVEAIVEFDYQAQHDDELTIAVGDIISNIRKDEGGWWEGEVDGRRGLFPDNFVREIKKEVKKEPSLASQTAGPKSDLSNGSASPGSESCLRPAKKGEAIRKRRCKAAFSYVPQNEDELELKIGDVIDVLGEVEEGWWEGSLNGKTGMFPSNFTKEMLADEEDLATPPEDTRSTKTSHTGSESDGGDSSSARSDAGSVASSSEIQPKKVRGFGFGDIFKDQPIKLRPRSMELDNELDKTAKKPAPAVAPETMKTEPALLDLSTAKELCKVLFPYDAQNEDELSIKEGDIITIVNKDCADAGWWLGELNGKQGVFPDNFVKLFIPEIEKEVRSIFSDIPTHTHTHTQLRSCCIKSSEIQKPAFPPKKPLPPKNNNSMNRPSSLPPKRPERPERPAVPNIQCCLFSLLVMLCGVYVLCVWSRARRYVCFCWVEDVEDFDCVISSTEKLNHPTASRPRVMDRRPRSQIFTSSSLSSPDLLDSPSPEEELHESKCVAVYRQPDVLITVDIYLQVPEKSSLPPKPSALLSSSGPAGAPLHPAQTSSAALRPHSPSVEPKGKGEQGPTLDELRNQLRELRATVELMKSQHNRSDRDRENKLPAERRVGGAPYSDIASSCFLRSYN